MRAYGNALKPGVALEGAIQAAGWPPWIELLDDDGSPCRERRLDFDTSARLLETVLLALERGDELVIHAVPAAGSASTCSIAGSGHDCRHPHRAFDLGSWTTR